MTYEKKHLLVFSVFDYIVDKRAIFRSVENFGASETLNYTKKFSIYLKSLH